MKLTALEVKNADPGRHGDGAGLYLIVDDRPYPKSKELRKRWVLRALAYNETGRNAGKWTRRDIGIGSAREGEVGLAEARDRAAEIRRMIRDGKDPVFERKKERREIPTFRQIAAEYVEVNRPTWRSSKHGANWIASMEEHIFPHIGDRLVDGVSATDIQMALSPIWLTRNETAKRLRQRIHAVLDYAHGHGHRAEGSPRHAVANLLPKVKRAAEHHASMPWQDLPAFFRDGLPNLPTSEIVKLALEFVILTASRSAEARGAVWSEIDFETRTWTVPASRMKAERTHEIPLSDRAIAILERARELAGTDKPDDFIFPSKRRGKSLVDTSLSVPLRRGGYPVTVHGFRSAFKNWAVDQTSAPESTSERALAHQVRNRVQGAYETTTQLDRRRDLMQRWSRFCCGENNVVQLAAETA